jgi:hypothetical protein
MHAVRFSAMKLIHDRPRTVDLEAFLSRQLFAGPNLGPDP